ncbi:MAG: LVIVD repeat-containing protein, partial [Limisphaerales bacterium]
TDREEGLVNVLVGTLVDGDPMNNFLRDDANNVVRFNPDGKLTGAMQAYMAGNNLYVVCKRGLEVVDVSNPLKPKIVGELADGFSNPRSIAVQFRYAFVTDDNGIKVVDITEPTKPVLTKAAIPLKHAGRVYAARTYAYVANGPEGLAIIDIENPTQPKLEMMYNANGALNDTRALQVGSVSASEFAIVADGKNGLRVIQLISPENVAEHAGFSPKPNPKLIATFPTSGPALAVSRGLDRDRVVDESGNQTVVFGRRGARPFHVDEMQAFYRHYSDVYTTNRVGERSGDIYEVDNVMASDGKLVTRDGHALPEPLATAAEPEKPIDRPSQERLIRRGGGAQ